MSGEPKTRSAAQWMVQLRKRHVLRVLAVYVVGAWISLQVADVAVLPALGIPDIGMRYVVAAVGVGFAIACILAWLQSGCERNSDSLEMLEPLDVMTGEPVYSRTAIPSRCCATAGQGNSNCSCVLTGLSPLPTQLAKGEANAWE